MRSLIVSVFFLFFFSVGYSQDLSKEYAGYVNKAFQFYHKNKFKEAKENYELAFISSGDRGKVVDRYNLALCLVALEDREGAFVQLQRIAEKGKFSSLDLLSMDRGFQELYLDPRWSILIEKVGRNKQVEDKAKSKYRKQN